jgi:hypothetical protein
MSKSTTVRIRGNHFADNMSSESTPMNTRTLQSTFVLVAVGLTAVSGQTPTAETIPEALARGASGRHHSVGSGTVGDPSSPEYLARWLANTHTILRGRAGAALLSYISDDQTEAYTDYVIEEPVFLYNPGPQAADRPGMPPSVKVTLPGGTVTLGGLSFRSHYDELPALATGTDCLFLLTRVGQRYLIINGFQGVFQVSNGKLVPLSKAAFAVPTAYRDADYSQAVPELLRYISTRK